MTRETKTHTPKYRRHRRPRSKDQAFVELDGSRHYLGPYDAPESREAYHRLLAEWSANGRSVSTPREDITVVEVCSRYWQYANSYYRRAEGTAKMVHRVKMGIRPVKSLYGRIRAANFGPNALRAVRRVWTDKKLSRCTVNHYVNTVRTMFKWAVDHELIPAHVHHALQAVEALRPIRRAGNGPHQAGSRGAHYRN